MLPRILLLEGPNLNLVGLREPHLYGSETAKEIQKQIRRAFSDRLAITFFQSNHEGELIDCVHEHVAAKDLDGAVVNLGAFTHTSIALRDAMLTLALPFIEVHLSNIYQRESFRQHSFFADQAKGVITGLGPYGYHAALEYFVRQANPKARKIK